MVSARTTVAAAHRALHNAPRRMRAAPPDAPCPLPPTHPRSLSRAPLRLLLLSLTPIAGHERAQAKLHTPPVRHEPAMPVPMGLLATHATDLSKYTSSLAHGPPLFSTTSLYCTHTLCTRTSHTLDGSGRLPDGFGRLSGFGRPYSFGWPTSLSYAATALRANTSHTKLIHSKNKTRQSTPQLTTSATKQPQ